LVPEYWTDLPDGVTYDGLGIARKKQNLERALEDYADYEGVDALRGTCMKVYSLLLHKHWVSSRTS